MIGSAFSSNAIWEASVFGMGLCVTGSVDFTSTIIISNFFLLKIKFIQFWYSVVGIQGVQLVLHLVC